MPIYDFKCEACDHKFDLMLMFTEFDDPQICPKCGQPAKRLLSLNQDFILKGDGWTGKAQRIKSQMKAKNKRLDSKKKDLPPTPKLQPNVDGEQTSSWADAEKLAASKGKIHEKGTIWPALSGGTKVS